VSYGTWQRHGTVSSPLLVWGGLEFALVGVAVGLLFRAHLFCLTGIGSVTGRNARGVAVPHGFPLPI